MGSASAEFFAGSRCRRYGLSEDEEACGIADIAGDVAGMFAGALATHGVICCIGWWQASGIAVFAALRGSCHVGHSETRDGVAGIGGYGVAHGRVLSGCDERRAALAHIISSECSGVPNRTLFLFGSVYQGWGFVKNFPVHFSLYMGAIVDVRLGGECESIERCHVVWRLSGSAFLGAACGGN